MNEFQTKNITPSSNSLQLLNQPTPEIAISTRQVSKMYPLYTRPNDRLKQSLWYALPKFMRGKPRRFYQEFWALREVSFEVKKGETVGIIGRNGSGKSTLLQIIAGTLAPTYGEAQVNGRVAALLELGSGFNPDFTGRENVYLNGAILGLSHAEVEALFDEIAAFADIGQFLDQPVKLYSSGMVVRLAFAVNACINPDILIVDEALSVGDMYFQTKCMGRITQLRDKGVTILFVSHSLQAVKSLCDHALYLENGQAVAFGEVERVTDLYSARSLHQRKKEDLPLATTPAEAVAQPGYISKIQPPFWQRITQRTGKGFVQFYECCLFQDNKEVEVVTVGRECVVAAWLEHKTDMPAPAEVGILVRNLDGLELFAVNSYFSAAPHPYPPHRQGERARIEFRFPVTLAPGIYNVVLGIKVPEGGELWDKVFNAAVFQVVTEDGKFIPGLYRNGGVIEYYQD
jgi:lipopolysaccharide transport system ATP-binding protein